MRIVIDLDGVICPVRNGPNDSYEALKPLPEAVSVIKRLRKHGHYIIIQTARNMATCEGNIGKVIKNVGKITLDWLANYDIEYDEIYFGKPNADIYIDDRAYRFNKWEDISEEDLIKKGKAR